MNHLFLFPVLTTILFCLAKFIEMRFFSDNRDETIPVKYLVRDAVIVFSSSFLVSYIHSMIGDGSIDDFMSIITETKTIPKITEIFTDTPEF